MIIKRKLHNLRREKKAFRAVGLILGALLICWLPFFVTLPLISILKHHGFIKDENTGNTWFKITFWLGYCNSAVSRGVHSLYHDLVSLDLFQLNPFVYAFSNRSIRRAFRQVICRRFCCCMCQKKGTYDHKISRRQRLNSASYTTDVSQGTLRRTNSYVAEVCRTIPKLNRELDTLVNSPFRTAHTGAPVVSFADSIAETAKDDDEEEPTNPEIPETLPKNDPTST